MSYFKVRIDADTWLEPFHYDVETDYVMEALTESIKQVKKEGGFPFPTHKVDVSLTWRKS